MTQNYKELEVWKKSHQFVLNVYRLTKNFPKEEMYGLTSQFRRAAVSIAANLAEGYGKKGKRDKLRFFNISEGSVQECDYYILLAENLQYLSTDSGLKNEIIIIGKMLKGYMKAIEVNLDKT
ncbi:MAG TPA: four helix bundle protein [Candidatus Marinimicrobia bacterium]|nr:MAG: four helix bundle protein [Candidatus Marinimicrobia bacterium CG1_02_48_14]PJA54636.1 MAG: four helix bundle protein [Candidatus Marinimicrobia bacterium CG_4_9_14_3_um_filter_48_9]HCW75351.1 four helix bundle protein [Candidatus Neomarinimicrobiota bacterium]